jgi:hypothetical protein
MRATYNGDPVNAPSAAPCGAEVLVVARRFNAGLPSTRRCLGSSLGFQLRRPTAVRSLALNIDVNGRVIKRITVAGKRRPLVVIRKLPKGNVSVRVIGITRSGSAFEDSRVFHRCGK